MLKAKKNIILQGAPGVGKTFAARRLAYSIMGVKDDSRIEFVQFHQNYSYEDFVMGYKPNENGFELKNGIFYSFCQKAASAPDKDYFFIIDEINRGNMSKIFGELLMLIERDYRGTKATLAYNGMSFSVPKNLYIIGTVNMDETTFSFSRKVLDRAMTIEMNEVDLEGGLDKKYESIGKLGEAELIGYAVEGVDVYADNKEVCDIAISYLKAINEKLEGTPFKVAYRTRNEFLLYVVNNLPYNKDENGGDIPQEMVIARALDEITNMKILSRIEGDETKVSERFLNDLRETIKKELNKISQKEYSGTKGKEGTEYAVSLAKLKEMTTRLGSGYTSFWS
mgnify:CR=1 FL=1